MLDGKHSGHRVDFFTKKVGLAFSPSFRVENVISNVRNCRPINAMEYDTCMKRGSIRRHEGYERHTFHQCD